MDKRKLSALGTIAAAAGTFALCVAVIALDEAENRATYEQAAQAYNPPPILNYVTADPDDTWAGGGTP